MDYQNTFLGYVRYCKPSSSGCSSVSSIPSRLAFSCIFNHKNLLSLPMHAKGICLHLLYWIYFHVSILSNSLPPDQSNDFQLKLNICSVCVQGYSYALTKKDAKQTEETAPKEPARCGAMQCDQRETLAVKRTL
jgi:hypothetical protein